VYRLAVLHVLGKRTDATVDDALIQLLADDALRATAAYLLGRVGYKGYLPRKRDGAAVRKALRTHIQDSTTFTDPFYQKLFRTQDFVIAAYIRVTGPSQFTFASSSLEDLIGLGLPEFSDDVRADLLAQIM
jgi:predicted transcriptional regulator